MAERWNVKYFGPTFLPPYEFMGNKRIAAVNDMKGVKMRISGLNAKALQRFGAVPTMVTAPEAYTALERGTIDSFGLPYAYTFGAYKLFEVSKYVTEGMAMSGLVCFQGVSITAWNKLPDNLKAKLPQAKKLTDEALFKAYKRPTPSGSRSSRRSSRSRPSRPLNARSSKPAPTKSGKPGSRSRRRRAVPAARC